MYPKGFSAAATEIILCPWLSVKHDFTVHSGMFPFLPQFYLFTQEKQICVETMGRNKQWLTDKPAIPTNKVICSNSHNKQQISCIQARCAIGLNSSEYLILKLQPEHLINAIFLPY